MDHADFLIREDGRLHFSKSKFKCKFKFTSSSVELPLVVLRIASPRPGMERYFSSLRPANANAMQLGPRYEMGPPSLGET
jgi:hypothetical protein